jgi:splicing factor 4
MNISLFLFGTGGPGKKGHHMGDYIPPEELEKFLATCNDAAAQKAFKEAGAKAKIQADNVGHKLLSKMGWKEGLSLSLSLSLSLTHTHARTHAPADTPT